MRQPFILSKTEFSIRHLSAREVVEQQREEFGGPVITDAVLEVAMQNGLTDQWQIVWRRLDNGDTGVHLVFTSEAEADASMDRIALEGGLHT